MSTTVATKSQRILLETVLHHGRECLANRRALIFKVAILFLFAPRALALLAMSRGSTAFVDQIRALGFSNADIIEELETLIIQNLLGGFWAEIAAYILTIVGILALAKLSMDYFELRPPTLSQAVKDAFRVFFRKGFGAFIMLCFLLVPISVLAILKVIVLCLLVNLPLTLMEGRRGGILSVVDTLFLKYVRGSTPKKWSVFSTMMTLGGVSLSVMFLLQMFLTYFAEFDLWSPQFFGWASHTVHLWGASFAVGQLTAHLVELFIDSAIIAIVMPFAAAVFFRAKEE